MKIIKRLLTAASAFGVIGLSNAGFASAGEAEVGSQTISAETSNMIPEAAAATASPAALLDAASRESLEARYLTLRERVTALQPAPTPADAADLAASGRPIRIEAASEVTTIRKNFVNTRAQAVSSTLAETAAANDQREVLYAGNTYLSRSLDSGVTWSALTYPAGPAEAPTACCDGDVVHHAPTDTTFNIMLYVNAALTNGNIRIFVRRGSNNPADCTYLIDPGGAANNVLPDYPHIAVSNGFLYLSTNSIQNGTTWIGSQMRRFNVAQMSNCQSTTTNTFTYTGSVGQRVFTPAEGATTTMMWGTLDSATVFRVFKWPESTTTVTQTTKSVNASAFNNPDCRGGTGNFDFIERSTSTSIAGFRMRGAIAGANTQWLWHSSAIGGQTQAHLRGLVVNTTTLATVAQPLVFNNGFCIGYPALGGNSDGEFALSVAAGGRAGGGGTAAQGYVSVDDSSTAGFFFAVISRTASGTHNRTDGRFGDYFTVRNSDRCARTWVATNYALSGGNTLPAHVNARYIEFQSSTEPSCPS
jgi:hypothetical protein